MSYTPTNWKNGDVVTSTKLNKMESGIVSASPYIVDMLWDEATEKSYLNKTAAEIAEAMKTRPVIVVDIGEDYALSWPMTSGWAYTNDYTFYILYEDQVLKFTATAADANPVQTEG